MIQVVLRPGLSFAYGTVSVCACSLQWLRLDSQVREYPASFSMHKRESGVLPIEQPCKREKLIAARSVMAVFSREKAGIFAISAVSIPLIL